MLKKHYVLSVILGVLSLSLVMPSVGLAAIEDAMVKVYVTSRTNRYFLPWATSYPKKITGSGCVIDGNRILTNAHVVNNQTYIQVRRYGYQDRFEARVLAVSHPADLALLTVDDPGFFEGIEPLQIGELPPLKAEVNVYGFPKGGDNLSVTSGVISRIEHTTYAHTLQNLFGSQLDAAVNGGNSGGPAMIDGKVVGVVMQNYGDAENTNYMVPSPVVRHFLRDIADGRYHGIPSLGLSLQNLENKASREYYRLPEGGGGQLVIETALGMPSDGLLLPGDVITHVEGHPIANDGTVEFRAKEWTSWNYFVELKQLGEEVRLTLLRQGREVTIPITLDATVEEGELISGALTDQSPSYYVYGGLIFTPVSLSLLKEYGNGRRRWDYNLPYNLANLTFSEKQTVPDEEAVIVTNILSSSVNQGYKFAEVMRVVEVNGKQVINLQQIIDLISQDQDQKFVVFKMADNRQVVINREQAAQEHAGILQRYRVPADRSPDLM